MSASTPSKKCYVPSFILCSWYGKPVGVKFERLRVEKLIQMNVRHIVRHERAFINGLTRNLKVIGQVAAQSRVILDEPESLSDDGLCHGHLILPRRQWNSGEALVYLLRGSRGGVSSEEILHFGYSFSFPLLVSAEIKKCPAALTMGFRKLA
jgi:hypothetical protein